MKNHRLIPSLAIAALVLTSLLGERVIAQVDLDKITTAAEVNPPGTNTRIQWQNPHFDGLNTFDNPKGDFAALDRGAVVGNAVILNFDEESGYPAAAISVTEEGKTVNVPGLRFINPAVADGRLSSITVKDAAIPRISLGWRMFDPASLALKSGDGGAGTFLIKDRDAGDAVSSGKQGIIAAPLAGDNGRLPGGILFESDKEFSGFACVANNQSASYTLKVVGFDGSGKPLFSYSVGIEKGKPVYFGILSKIALKSVWLGQGYAEDGTVFDDIAFIPKQ
jgi:hypothetical protein